MNKQSTQFQTRKPSQATTTSHQSYRSSNMKSPGSSQSSGFNSQSPMFKPQQHIHKNSHIDLTQLAKLINNQKQEIGSNTLNLQLPSQKDFVSGQRSGLSSRGGSQSNLSKHVKQLSADQNLVISPKNQILKNSSVKSTIMNLQPFVKLQSLKGIATENTEKEDNGPSKRLFNSMYVIGIGGFGKVWKVELKKAGQTYAMKEMSKALVITKKSVASVMNERQLLSQLKHPYIVNMYYAFQDRENLYLVMDYMMGGDLRYHIGRMRRFNEETTKFFVACIFVALEYMHSKNIIHRDIKPENLVMDDTGYIRITDLGIARVQRDENKEDTSGTPGYMAPEVMCRMNHSYAVDYFALGVIAYEFMMGRRPYVGRSRQEIREQILAKQVSIKKIEIPEGWSMEATDFVNRLLQRKPSSRLGYNGSQEIRSHPWFKNFQWMKLQRKELRSPFLPNAKDNFDQKQILIEDEENAELIQQNILLLKDNSVQDLFQGYEFTNQKYETLTTQTSLDIQSPKHTRLNTAGGRF